MARAHGTGTLVKRGKYFMARWVVDGKVYTRTTKCKTKREAEKKLEEFTKPFREKSDIEVLENLAAKVRVVEAQRAEAEDIKDSKPVKLDFLVDTFTSDLDSSTITAGTEAQYNAIVNQLMKFTHRTFVHEVTNDDAKKFLVNRKANLGVGTYNHYIATLKMLWRVAMKHDKRIKVNVWENYSKLKVDKSVGRRELTTDEVKKLCDTAEKSTLFNGEFGTLFMVGVYTGLRISDCKALKWCDIDMERKIMVVLPIKTSKNGRKAHIPIHPKLYERLSNIDRTDKTHVMPNIALCNKRALMSAVNKVFKDAGIETSVDDENGKKRMVTGFHAFRHYFISNCVKNGIPVSVVQQMVAHSTASMSLAYTHTFDSDLRLPDYDGETERITLKKTTIEALEKAKGVQDLDDFLMKLLEGKTATPVHVKTKSDIELEKALDDMFDNASPK